MGKTKYRKYIKPRKVYKIKNEGVPKTHFNSPPVYRENTPKEEGV